MTPTRFAALGAAVAALIDDFRDATIEHEDQTAPMPKYMRDQMIAAEAERLVMFHRLLAGVRPCPECCAPLEFSEEEAGWVDLHHGVLHATDGEMQEAVKLGGAG